MHTTPTAPLIRIDKGKCCGIDLSGATATLVDIDNPAHGYYILDGPLLGWTINDDQSLNEITAWRPCVAVPIGELAFMRDAFMGAELSKNQIAAIQRLSSYSPRVVADESQ